MTSVVCVCALARPMYSALYISNLTPRTLSLRFHAADSSGGSLSHDMRCVHACTLRVRHCLRNAGRRSTRALCSSTSSFHRYFLCFPLCRGGSKQVIEFLKANFSRTTAGPGPKGRIAWNDKPLLHTSTYIFVNLPGSLFFFSLPCPEVVNRTSPVELHDISDHNYYKPCHVLAWKVIDSLESCLSQERRLNIENWRRDLSVQKMQSFFFIPHYKKNINGGRKPFASNWLDTIT